MPWFIKKRSLTAASGNLTCNLSLFCGKSKQMGLKISKTSGIIIVDVILTFILNIAVQRFYKWSRNKHSHYKIKI